MKPDSATENEREARLEQVLAEYVQASEKGTPLDPQQLLAQHPDLANDLKSFFANRAEMDRLARPLQSSGFDATVGLAGAEAVADFTPIRYFGDYELLAELGRGGMGVVYRAKQTTLNRFVALKMILTGQLASPDDVLRFRQEAEASANLDHPHIAPIYETGEHQGQHYFSMKLIEGKSLREALPALHNDIPTAVEILTHVARGVHHAHQRGVLHRDLKPANILLDATNRPFITDFGLAKRVEGGSDVTRTGAIVGTPSYMAPEQAQGEKQLTTAVDVYSLGAILYELPTGQPPFRGEQPMETLLQVISKEPKPPRQLNPRVDRDLETIALKCLEKDPARRYDSAAALAADLERWQRHEPIVARPATLAERSRKWAQRHPAAAALLMVSGLSLLTVLAVFIFTDVALRHAHSEILVEQDKTNQANQLLTHEKQATQKALDKLQHVAYGQQLTLARMEWEANNVGRARQLLDASPAEMRHWEWNYVHGLCHSEVHSLECAAPDLRAIAFHPDGNSLLAAGGMIGFGPFLGTQHIHRWNVATGAPLPAFHQKPPDGSVTGFAWGPRGTIFAESLWCLDDARDVVLTSGKTSEDSAGRVEIWNAETGKLLHSLKGHHSFVNGVALSSDGARVASASSDQTSNVWDAETGAKLFSLKGHRGQVMCVAFNPAGTLIATGSQGPLSDFGSLTPNDFGEVKLWNAADGTEKLALAGHELGVLSLAFSPDGTLLATASRDRLVKLWDVASGKLSRTFYGHGDDVNQVTFSADGARLATASGDRTVRVWDAQSGQPLTVLRGHTQGVKGVAFHPDQRRLASCSQRNEVKMWDLSESPDAVVSSTRADEVDEIAVSPTGDFIAAHVAVSGSRIWELRVLNGLTGELLGKIPAQGEHISQMQFATNPTRLFTMVHGEELILRRYDLSTPGPWKVAQELSVKQYDKSAMQFGNIDPVLTADGQTLATYDHSQQAVVVFDVAAGKQIRKLEHPAGEDVEMRLSRDNQVLVTMTNARIDRGEDFVWRTIAISAWNLHDGKRLLAVNPENFYGWRIAVSPRGNWLAIASKDQRESPGVRLWDLQGKQEPRDLAVELPECIEALFAPDRDRLLTVHASDDRAQVLLWDPETGDQVATLSEMGSQQQFAGYREGIEFAPDGKRIFTCGAGMIRVWNAEAGNLLLTLRPAHSPMQISRDGRRVVAAGPQGVIQVWTADVAK